MQRTEIYNARPCSVPRYPMRRRPASRAHASDPFHPCITGSRWPTHPLAGTRTHWRHPQPGAARPGAARRCRALQGDRLARRATHCALLRWSLARSLGSGSLLTNGALISWPPAISSSDGTTCWDHLGPPAYWRSVVVCHQREDLAWVTNGVVALALAQSSCCSTGQQPARPHAHQSRSPSVFFTRSAAAEGLIQGPGEGRQTPT